MSRNIAFHTKTSLQNAQYRRGFTIVELIVVIVVIGILAAITIVSYNAVSQQSRKQAIANDLQSTSSLLKKVKAEQGSFPASLNAISVANSSTKTVYAYYYRVNTDGYCLQGSAFNMTMRLYSGKDNAEDGSCNLTAITATNLVRNPSFTSVPTSILSYSGISASSSVQTSPSPDSGSSFLRLDINSSGQSTLFYNINSTSTTVTPLTNTPYTTSLSLRPSKPMLFNVRYTWNDSSGNAQSSPITTVSAPGNVWTRFSITGQFFSVTNLKLSIATNTGSNWASGDDLDIDSMMITQGSTNYDFSDGTSSGWAWNGTANNSSSRGPGRIGGQPVYQ